MKTAHKFSHNKINAEIAFFTLSDKLKSDIDNISQLVALMGDKRSHTFLGEV